jgi:hypothetical protein
VSRCIEPNVAEGLLHGRLSPEEFAQALKHAAGCADCRQLLFATSQPEPEVQAGSMDAIQERLTTWRAARRAPLMPAFPWHKGHEVDRYVITRSVGGTEDGVIYEAFDPEREERVVVKQLDLHVDDPATPALMAIATRLCQFSHPNVLQMLSVGVHAGFVYIVYEFIKGTPLSQIGAEDPRQLLALFAEAGRGLAAAHAAGIVHACFSAASCVVGRDGRVKVLDFGIGEARVHRIAATRSVHDDDWTIASDQVNSEDSFVGFIPTRRHPPSGQFESIILAAGPNALGPWVYAAPELVLGAPPSPASDQFSFCAALYHQLYGQPAVGGATISLWLRELVKGRSARPPTRDDVPAMAQAALLRGLAREPAVRFDGMASLVARLQRQRPVLGNRRRTIAAVAIGVTVVAIGVVIGSEVRGGAAGRDGSCDRALAGWDTLWSPGQQDELTRASGPSVAETWPALQTQFSAWIGSWRTATHGFCSLPDDGAPSSRSQPSQASDCTSRAHAAASDLLQLVKDGAPARLTFAAAAAEALPTFDQCTSRAPSPGSAPLAAVKADVRRRLGLLDEADQLTANPPADPAQRSYQSLVRGHIAADRGDLMEARRLFEAAAFEAQAAHQPELGATAAIQRLALSCSGAERALWGGYVTAQLPPGRAQDEVRGALAESLSCEGRIADAVKLRHQVEAALHDDETAAGGAAALDLARAQLAVGDTASADTFARRAAAIYARIYGTRHPLAQTARLTAAEAELGSPASSAAAAETIVHVLAQLRDHADPDPVRARALVLQSRLADARGQRDEALHLIQRAVQEYEAALGGAHPELASAMLGAGDLLLADGHDQEAEASYRQVAAIFETLGRGESSGLDHARAGIQLARWGARPPADADETLQWGLSPTGGAIDPGVAGWVAEQLGRRAAARGDKDGALTHYRAAATAWQQSGDQRGLASALTQAALLAVELHDADARSLLEQALQVAVADKPRLQGELARLLWPAQRERARALAHAAIADLPDTANGAGDLKRWLLRHDTER